MIAGVGGGRGTWVDEVAGAGVGAGVGVFDGTWPAPEDEACCERIFCAFINSRKCSRDKCQEDVLVGLQD